LAFLLQAVKTQIQQLTNNSNLTTRKRLLLDHAVRTNETNVASAWSSLESSKSFLNSVKVQVRAAQIANEGIAAEYERGSRTTLRCYSVKLTYCFQHKYL
jgi:outer membrane protein